MQEGKRARRELQGRLGEKQTDYPKIFLSRWMVFCRKIKAF